jgi:hypothetical protein
LLNLGRIARFNRRIVFIKQFNVCHIEVIS